jgi:DNA polymerase-3 subunit delta
MKIPPRQISNFLSKPPENFAAFLFHGTDNGLISERATKLAYLFNQDLDDVFSVTRLTGELLSDDVGLIVDSAAAIPALGGRRLVLVKGRGTELLAACKQALSRHIEEAIIIVEAHETNTRHALIKLFESSKTAASIGCYADSVSDIRALASDILAADNIEVSSDSLDIIARRLGGDRGSSRREIEKLALMAGPNGKLDEEEVHFALGDNAKLAIDDIADALASGAVARLQQSLQKAWHEDTNAVIIVRGCQNYFQQLGLAGYAMRSGQSAQSAIRSLRPPPHFKTQKCLQSHLQRWQPRIAMDIVNRLHDVESQIKSNRLDDQIYISQSLLGICLRAPR